MAVAYSRPSTACGTPVCRICFGEGCVTSPLQPVGCACKGDLARVHDACLRTWFEHSRKKHCEICLEPLEQLQPLKTPPRRYELKWRDVGPKVYLGSTFYFQGKSIERAACCSEAVRLAIWGAIPRHLTADTVSRKQLPTVTTRVHMPQQSRK